MSAPTDPVPDARAQEIVRVAGELTCEPRKRVLEALDRLEPAWARVLLRIGPEAGRELVISAPVDIGHGRSVEGIIDVATQVSARYSRPAVTVGAIALALVLTARLDESGRAFAAGAIADEFADEEFGDLTELVHTVASESETISPDTQALPLSVAAVAEQIRQRGVILARADFHLFRPLWSRLTTTVAGALVDGIRMLLVLGMVLEAAMAEQLLLVPIALSAWLATQHPYDRPLTIERLGAVGEKIRICPISWYALLVPIFCLCHASTFGARVMLALVVIELLCGIGEMVAHSGVRIVVPATSGVPEIALRLPGRVARYEAFRYLTRVSIALAGAVAGIGLATMIPGAVPWPTPPILLVAAMLLGRGRLLTAALLFGVAVHFGAGPLDIAIVAGAGAIGFTVLAIAHRVPPEPLPIPRPAVSAWLRVDGRRVHRAHRRIRRGRYADAADVPIPDGGPLRDVALLVQGWALARDHRPEAALTAVQQVNESSDHLAAIRAIIEVGAQLDLGDTQGARAAATVLADCVRSPRANLTVRREAAVALTCLGPPANPAEAVEWVETVARLVPRFLTTGRAVVATRLIAACAESAVPIDPGLARGLLAVRCTATGTTTIGTARDFEHEHRLVRPEEGHDDDAVIVVRPEQVDTWYEVLLLTRCRRHTCKLNHARPYTTPRIRALTADLDRYLAGFVDYEQGRRAELDSYRRYFAALQHLDRGANAAARAELGTVLALPLLDRGELSRHPRTAAATEALGVSYLRDGEDGAAAAALEQVATLVPVGAIWWRRRAAMMRGMHGTTAQAMMTGANSDPSVICGTSAVQQWTPQTGRGRWMKPTWSYTSRVRVDGDVRGDEPLALPADLPTGTPEFIRHAFGTGSSDLAPTVS